MTSSRVEFIGDRPPRVQLPAVVCSGSERELFVGVEAASGLGDRMRNFIGTLISWRKRKPRDPVGGPSCFYLFFFGCSSAFAVPQLHSNVIEEGLERVALSACRY